MRAPEEVYKREQQGTPTAADELSREDRTRLRAKKKRAGKKRKLQQVWGLLCHTLPCTVSVSGLYPVQATCFLKSFSICMHGLLVSRVQAKLLESPQKGSDTSLSLSGCQLAKQATLSYQKSTNLSIAWRVSRMRTRARGLAVTLLARNPRKLWLLPQKKRARRARPVQMPQPARMPKCAITNLVLCSRGCRSKRKLLQQAFCLHQALAMMLPYGRKQPI